MRKVKSKIKSTVLKTVNSSHCTQSYITFHIQVHMKALDSQFSASSTARRVRSVANVQDIFNSSDVFSETSGERKAGGTEMSEAWIRGGQESREQP